MDNQQNKESSKKAAKSGKAPAKRGRKQLPTESRKKYAIGSFWFSESEKKAYDELYKASGMNNQTEFFRRIIFGGGLKLYYFDKNTELIYEKLGEIQSEIESIGNNFNQVTTRVNSVGSDKNLFSSLNELKILLRKTEGEMRTILGLVERLIEHSDEVKEEEKAMSERMRKSIEES